MLLLKPYKIQIKFINLVMLILFGFSATSQIDNGTDYIPDSRSSESKAGSLCDQLFTKNGKIFKVLVKDTTTKFVKYKMCRDYGTNATVSGALISLENSKIEKIIFSNGLVREYKAGKSLLGQRIFIAEEENNTDKTLNLLVTGLDLPPSDFDIITNYLRYVRVKNFGYYASVYTDYGLFYGLIGSTVGISTKINNKMVYYLGGGFEFIDEEGQLETGLVINVNKIPIDISFRYNFDYTSWSGIRLGTGIRF